MISSVSLQINSRNNKITIHSIHFEINLDNLA